MQSNQPHTFVVVTLDPPIRKGQTLYPHIVLQVFVTSFVKIFLHVILGITFYSYASLQFETDYVVQSTLQIGDELLHTKFKDKLEPSYKVNNCSFLSKSKTSIL